MPEAVVSPSARSLTERRFSCRTPGGGAASAASAVGRVFPKRIVFVEVRIVLRAPASRYVAAGSVATVARNVARPLHVVLPLHAAQEKAPAGMLRSAGYAARCFHLDSAAAARQQPRCLE